MFSTDQFRVFPEAPADRVLSRPRRLLQEGRAADAEAAYRTVVKMYPEVKQGWVEYFALLRHSARHDEALALAERAAGHFGEEALPAALRGAALVELGRFREGLTALDDAACRDPDLAMVWHEAGYAAWRLGELSRALMALDRAFALEPHSGTLHLRGKVLRQGGRYLAAEVAFEGAAQAAEFAIQREAAEREIGVTRRYAAFPGTRPDTLPPIRRWFAETGSVPLTGGQGDPAGETAIARAVSTLAGDLGWRFSVLVSLDAWEGWYDLAQALGIPVATVLPEDAASIPLVVARDPTALPSWVNESQAPARRGRGLSMALYQDPELTPADLTGQLTNLPPHAVDLAFAIEAAQHPESRLRGRVLA
jgi:tetratricopeptide (TPR) repeat protein